MYIISSCFACNKFDNIELAFLSCIQPKKKQNRTKEISLVLFHNQHQSNEQNIIINTRRKSLPRVTQYSIRCSSPRGNKLQDIEGKNDTRALVKPVAFYYVCLRIIGKSRTK